MGVNYDVSAALRAANTVGAMGKRLATAEARTKATLARRLKPEANRDIRDEYNLTTARVNKGLTVRVVGGNVELWGAGEGIGLAQGYRGRQTKGGVVVTIRLDTGPQTFKHAFIQVPGGKAEGTGPQAFEREGRGAPRYPVDRLYSQNLAGMLRVPARRERLRNFSQRLLTTECRRQLGLPT